MANQDNGLGSRNSLIVKIALFLNFLNKDNYRNLIDEILKYSNPSAIDILKFMLTKKYISPKDIPPIKHACLNFAKSQDDIRFGSLCIEFNFLTQSNLNLALEEQHLLVKNGNSIRIGDLLVDAGMISKRQKDLILQKQKIETRINHPDADNFFGKNGKYSSSKTLDQSNMREIREPGIIIFIQNDGLKAFLKKTDPLSAAMPLADLKLLLEKNGVIYGVIDDDRLESFIKSQDDKPSLFEAAGGIAPIDGTDAQIVYLFETDYLKAGSLSEDGTIDFKNRGDIPFVAQGDAIAQKIQAKTGKDGINIFGDIIPHRQAMDQSFNLGKNIHLSEDELTVIASAEGNPKVSPGGEISVNAAYFIEGDVDYTTGHVKFDKNVYITGSIKSGFRVEAIDVVANTIDGGIVKAQGDVFVKNGVTESSIEAKGNVKAGFMHRSKVKCMGNMAIAKEVVDTDILIEGSFDIRKGQIYSSKLCAKGGVKVYAIGSEKSKPSHITVGTSLYMEKELLHIDNLIEKEQNLLEEKTTEKNRMQSEKTAIEEKLENLELSRQRTLSMVQEMEKNNAVDKAGIFQKSQDEAEQKIHDLQDQKARLEIHLKKIEADISLHTESVKAGVKEKFMLKRLNQKNPPKPIVDIFGKAYSGNKISGNHTNFIFNQNISHYRIMEIENSQDNKSTWEMVTRSL